MAAINFLVLVLVERGSTMTFVLLCTHTHDKKPAHFVVENSCSSLYVVSLSMFYILVATRIHPRTDT